MRSSRSRRTALAAPATRATRTTWSTRRTTTAARCCWLLSRRRAPAMPRRSLSGLISPSLARVTIEAEPFESALRGRGVAKEMLEHLEAVAATMGAHRLVLETGVYQEEAIGLYVRAGFRQIDCWGEYATAPTSVCYEKQL